MAKNWTIKEMVDALQENDKSAIQDFTRRNPIVSSYLSRALAGEREALIILLSNVPEFLSARKMESILKEDVEPYEEDDATEKPAKKSKKESKGKKEKKADKAEKPAKKEKKAKEASGDIKNHPLYGLTKKSDFSDVKSGDLMSFKKEAGISGADWGKGKDDAISAVIKWNKKNAKGGSSKAKAKDDEDKPVKKNKKKDKKNVDKKSKKSKKKAKEVDEDDDDDDDDNWGI